MIYPEDSLQNVFNVENWWEKTDQNELEVGSLIQSYLPFVSLEPYVFIPCSRQNAEDHQTAKVSVQALNVNVRRDALPVAGMPVHQGEVWSAFRAKFRPCIVLAAQSNNVESNLTKGKASRSTAPTYLIAPFYGSSVKGGKRAGYSEAFIERVRHCEYPQFHWDYLPHIGGEESILRLDHLTPIGTSYKSYKNLNYKLCKQGVDLLRELLAWHIDGNIKSDGDLASYKNIIAEVFPAK